MMIEIEPELLDYKAEEKWFEDRDLELIGIKYINDGHIDPNATYRLSLQKIIIEEK